MMDQAVGTIERTVGRSRLGLETVLGVSNLTEFRNRTEIRLPDVVFTPATRAVKETNSDHSERFIEFSVDKGNRLTAGEAILGPLSSWSLLGGMDAYVGLENESLAKRLRKRFLTPGSIFFHTHPLNIDGEYLLKQDSNQLNLLRKLGRSEEEIRSRLDHDARTIDIVGSIFSSNDLRFMRYYKSALLGTKNGYRFIVNPNSAFHLPRRYSPIRRYSGAIDELCKKINKIDSVDAAQRLTELRGEADKMLIQYCKDQGLLLFGNDDPENPVLRRLQ